MTEQQALLKLTTLCSQAEHCSGEMLEKMQRWELPDEVQARIMEHLVREKYVDDERFCRFFIRDKIRYNGWGRRKIEQALNAKHIDRHVSDPVFADIADDEYLAVLRPLLLAKQKSIKGSNDYERSMKLIRFALGRGFDIDIVRQCVDHMGEEDL